MAREPILLLLVGTPGSGKSTVAAQVVRRTGWTYLDADAVSSAFSGDDRDSARHRSVRNAVYEGLYALASANLGLGNSVVLDAPHVRALRDPAWFAGMRHLAADAGATLRIVRCWCREDVLRRRLTERGLGRDRVKLERWSEFLADEPIRQPLEVGQLDLDTSDGADLADVVIAFARRSA